MKALLILATLSLSTAYAQQVPRQPRAPLSQSLAPSAHEEKPAPKKVIPKLPDALISLFYKQQAAVLTGSMNLEQTPQFKDLQRKKDKLDNLMQQMLKVCGDGYNIMIDENNDPSCSEIPKPAEEEKKK